jgi:hypothetical protein
MRLSLVPKQPATSIAVNAVRPLAEGACCIAGKNKKRDMYQNKGKKGVSAIANSVAVSVPLLQVSLTLHMLNDTIGNKALSCVSRTKEWVKGA